MKAFYTLVSIVMVSLSANATVSDDIAAAKKQVEQLQQDVARLATPLLVKDADVKVFASLAPIVAAAARINALPAANRAVSFQSTTRNGYLWKDDATWCGSFVELNDANALHGTGMLDAISAAIDDDGSILMRPTLSINGHVQLHFHFMGPRVKLFGIGGGACPPGGGAGTSIGVGFDKGQQITMKVAFNNSAKDAIGYNVAIVSPSAIDVTAQVGLGAIGNVGIPQTFNLPSSPIATGVLPLLIQNSGRVQLPGGAGEKSYSLVLVPVAFTPAKAGLTASWKAVAQFLP